MKFNVGDLVEYRIADTGDLLTGVILNKAWRENETIWFYKLYFFTKEDEAWIEESDLQQHGGRNGLQTKLES